MRSRCVLCLCGLVVAWLALPLAGEDRVYQIITPKPWKELLQPLIEARGNGGWQVELVTTDSLLGGEGKVTSEKVKEAIRQRRPTVCVLVGDVPEQMPSSMAELAVPACAIEPDAYGGSRSLVSDSAYGVFRKDADKPADEASHVPSVQVGRLSAQTEAELKAVVAKIVAADKPTDFGPWRRRINLIGSAPSFGKDIDSLLDGQIAELVDATIPPQFDVSMTYGRIYSPYCWPPVRFDDKVVERFNEGCLVFAFMGHAYSDHVAEVRDDRRGGQFPVLDADVARRFAAREGTATVCLLLTCDAGKFDRSGGDCLAEAVFKQPRGPVAVIASTRFSWPYGHSIFGKQFMEAVCKRRAATVGEALAHAYRTMLAEPDPNDALRQQIERTAEQLKKGLASPAERIMHVYLYNLLGDPATPIPAPPQRLAISARGAVSPGASLQVNVQYLSQTGGIDGEAEITVELPRTVNPFPLQKRAEDAQKMDEALETNYRNAHNKVLARATFPIQGEMQATVRLPAASPLFGATNTYYVKVYITGRNSSAFGATTLVNPD